MKWGTRIKPGAMLVQYAARRLGISEVDVRDFRVAWNADVVQIRTWNHLKFDIKGIDLFIFDRHPFR